MNGFVPRVIYWPPEQVLAAADWVDLVGKLDQEVAKGEGAEPRKHEGIVARGADKRLGLHAREDAAVRVTTVVQRKVALLNGKGALGHAVALRARVVDDAPLRVGPDGGVWRLDHAGCLGLLDSAEKERGKELEALVVGRTLSLGGKCCAS